MPMLALLHARPQQEGTDRFSIIAKLANDDTAIRTFEVAIAKKARLAGAKIYVVFPRKSFTGEKPRSENRTHCETALFSSVAVTN